MAILLMNNQIPVINNSIINKFYDGSKLKVITTQDQKHLAKQNIVQSILCFLIPQYHKYHMQKTQRFLSNTLKNNPQNEELKNKIYILQAGLVNTYKNKKSLQKTIAAVERTLVASDSTSNSFRTKENKAQLNKWNRYAGPNSEDLFKKFPEFTSWVTKSKLLSQMKIFPNPNGIRLQNGKPEIKVTLFQKGTSWSERKTKWMPFEDFKKDFSFEYSKKRETTIITHNETKKVYTFLGNGKGLQAFDPWDVDHSLVERPVPITILDNNQINEAQQVAFQFSRDNHKNSSNDFVLQIVTSYIKGKDWNSTKLVLQSKHPYIRIIATKDIPDRGIVKGAVYEISFGWQTGKGLPFKVKTGQFKALDLWEYQRCQERVVTNIPVTPEEAQHFLEFAKKYHISSLPPAFHLRKQNCSVFVETAMIHLNITQNGLPIAPTYISFTNLAAKMAPNHLRNISYIFASVGKATLKPFKWTAEHLPNYMGKPLIFVAKKVSKVVLLILEVSITMLALPFIIALGGSSGNSGRRIVAEQEKRNSKLSFSLCNVKNWFLITSYDFHLPGIIQKWQRKQKKGTVIFKNPQYLTIMKKPVPQPNV